MSFLNALMTSSLIVFISLIAAAQPGTGAVVHPCSKLTECTLMTKCSSAFSSGDRRKFPRICKWENSFPWVCCPTPASLKAKPATEFSENDCAGPQSIELSRDSLSRFKRDFQPAGQVSGAGGGGGVDVISIINYPFMVAIYQNAGKEKVFLCGGSLISKGVILTAAHCFLARKDSSKYMVQLGSVNFESGGTSVGLKEFQVSSVKIHEQFKFPQLYNDVALVKFKGLKGFSDFTRPVCLMDKAEDKKTNLEVAVLGWGQFGFLSTILQDVKLQVIPNRECNSTLHKLGVLTVSFPRGIVNKIMCAGSPDYARRDACQGDSGGPLVALVNGKWRQRGIVSGGIGCGIPGNPGLYTRVAEYITWIKANA